MRILTSGESHGEAITAIIEGFPKGVTVTETEINKALSLRQKGYGRGGRMSLEKDQARIVSGLRNKVSLGSPITVVVKNNDQTVFAGKKDLLEPISVPRPAHADLAAAFKYHEKDMRSILERASARETVARVCAGSVCMQFLSLFNIRILSFVSSLGPVSIKKKPSSSSVILKRTAGSCLNCPDPEAEKKMIRAIDRAAAAGDTLGGVAEVWAENVPPGLGSFMHYDQRLDARIAAALMSIPAVKGVEIGAGFSYAAQPGSKTHDSIAYSSGKGFSRSGNNAGGIEGGISNGNTVVARLAMKPIATLINPLPSVNLKTFKKASAATVRSDVCAVPACSVVAEHMLAIVLTEAFLDKFGKDCLSDIRKSFKTYQKSLQF